MPAAESAKRESKRAYFAVGIMNATALAAFSFQRGMTDFCSGPI